jgi:hypothetical protein
MEISIINHFVDLMKSETSENEGYHKGVVKHDAKRETKSLKPKVSSAHGPSIIKEDEGTELKGDTVSLTKRPSTVSGPGPRIVSSIAY